MQREQLFFLCGKVAIGLFRVNRCRSAKLAFMNTEAQFETTTMINGVVSSWTVNDSSRRDQVTAVRSCNRGR
jgi:hypothetical protein